MQDKREFILKAGNLADYENTVKSYIDVLMGYTENFLDKSDEMVNIYRILEHLSENHAILMDKTDEVISDLYSVIEIENPPIA